MWYDRWYLRFSIGELSLPDLLREINFRSELFLDIKSATPLAAEAVLRLYHDNEAMMPHTLVSSREWRLLDQLGEAGTEMRMFYSVGRASGIDALFRRAKASPRPAGTSIRQTLLSAEVIARLHEAGLQVFAWTVNNRHRAEELLSWGVDGLISDEIGVHTELRRGGAGEAGRGTDDNNRRTER